MLRALAAPGDHCRTRVGRQWITSSFAGSTEARCGSRYRDAFLTLGPRRVFHKSRSASQNFLPRSHVDFFMTPGATLGLAGSGRQSYFSATRAPRYSLLFALPLLIVYEMLAATLSGPRGTGVRNGADVILKELAFAAMGTRGPIVLMALIIGASVYLVWRDWKRSGGVRGAFFGGMLVESSVLAIVFGLIIGTITARLLGAMHLLMMNGGGDGGALAGMSGPTRLMLSLGAGLYEELLFRVFLVSAIAAIGKTLLGLGRRGAGILAAVVGAVIFSAFHYIGRYGDPFEIQSFAFRALSGLAFSAIYLLRGFGITAWTHALYDTFLLLL